MAYPRPFSPKVISCFDALVAYVADGHSIEAACRRYAVLRPSLTRYVDADPERRSRLAQACETDSRPARFFDDIIALIDGGLSQQEACASDPRFPSVGRLQAFLAKHPQHAARMKAAIRARESSPRRRYNARQKFSHADYCRAVDLLKAHPKRSASELLGTSGLPAIGMLHWYKTKNRDFAKLMAGVSIARPKPKARPRPSYRDGLLRYSLSRNEIYSLADRATPRKLDPHMRDDVRQEIVLGLLSHSIEPDDLRINGYRIVGDIVRRCGYERFASLSMPAGEFGQTLIDTLTADVWHEAA